MSNQKGIAHLLVLILVLGGIALGVVLTFRPQIFNPKAFEDSNFSEDGVSEGAKEFEGFLNISDVFIAPSNTSYTSYSLEPLNEKDPFYILEFKDISKLQLKSGSKVRLKGTLSDKKITVNNLNTDNLQIIEERGSLKNDFNKKVLVLLTVPRGVTIPSSKSQDLEQLLFQSGVNSIQGYYQRVTQNKVILDFEVHDWFQIEDPVDSTGKINYCSYDGLRSFILSRERLEQENNRNLESYSAIMHFFPALPCSGLSWNSPFIFAAANQGTSNLNNITLSRSYFILGTENNLNTAYLASAIVHELGHNIELHHANLLECKNDQGVKVPIYTLRDCRSEEYYDDSSPMGHANQKLVYFNGVNIHHLNSSNNSIRLIDSASKITISAMASQQTIGSGATRIVMIRRPSARDVYFLEYRIKKDQDALISDKFTSGVTIRLGSEDNYTSSYLINPNASLPYSTSLSLCDPGTSDCNSEYFDPYDKIRIKQLRRVTYPWDGVEIEISFE